MPVGDVFWFSDGSPFRARLGDEIQLLGTTNTARVVRIDYPAYADPRPALVRRSAQGVALKFSGLAPISAPRYEGAP